MTTSSIISPNSHITSNWSCKFHVTTFQILIALHSMSWQHYFRIGYNSQSTSIYEIHHPLLSVQIHILHQICLEIFPATLFPIYIALQIRSWQQSFTSVPIHRPPQIRSWHHHLPSVLIHIVLKICRKSFLSHSFQYT
jgi:hypothetical protein